MTDNKIYLLLTDTGTVLTKIIKCYTRKPYNHASIAFDENLMDVFSFGRKIVNNPFIGGFVRENIHSPLFNGASCALYSLTVTSQEQRRMKMYIQDLYDKKEQYRYNFLGLFGVLLKMPIERRNAFFCSQFVATVLKEGIDADFEYHPSIMEPSALPHCADFQLLFEGPLDEYLQIAGNRLVHVPYPNISNVSCNSNQLA